VNSCGWSGFRVIPGQHAPASEKSGQFLVRTWMGQMLRQERFGKCRDCKKRSDGSVAVGAPIRPQEHRDAKSGQFLVRTWMGGTPRQKWLGKHHDFKMDVDF